METASGGRKVLVVDDDEVLLDVVSRVLTRAGFDVLRATTVAEALRQADSGPEVVLLDLCLPDGDGVGLARDLHARRPGLPLVLMTAHSTRLREHPNLADQFARVLVKPVGPQQLQQVLNEVCRTDGPMNQPTPNTNREPVGASEAPDGPLAAPRPASPPRRRAGPFIKAVQSVGLLVVVGVVLLVFVGYVLGVRIPGMDVTPDDTKIEKGPPRLGVDLVPGHPHTLKVPDEVRSALGIRKGGRDQVEVVKAPREGRPLVLYGSTALDPARLVRVRARFAPAEVVQIGEHASKPGEVGNPSLSQTLNRELRPGDRVHKGDVLGVFFSVDVGSKKNDLLDALVQYELDQKIYDNMSLKSSAIPEVMLLTQWRAVQTDRNAINRALNNLKVWNIPQEEIDALHEEARKISSDKNAWFKTPEGRWVKGEKQGKGRKFDPDSDNDNPWGRVTLRAPFEGVIVERNVTVHEIVQDPTTNLFQIAQVKRLLVVANAPEDELPTLNALKPEERQWSVHTVGATASAELRGAVEEIGYLIDPNQHTAVIKGYIENPKEQIRAGQFVSCTIQIPPPKDVVEVPINAVVEDGKYAVVFVQPDPARPEYTMRRVQLTHRFEKTALVRSKPFTRAEELTEEERELGLQPLEPLRPGERVLRSGVGELKAALLDLESRPAKDGKNK